MSAIVALRPRPGFPVMLASRRTPAAVRAPPGGRSYSPARRHLTEPVNEPGRARGRLRFSSTSHRCLIELHHVEGGRGVFPRAPSSMPGPRARRGGPHWTGETCAAVSTTGGGTMSTPLKPALSAEHSDVFSRILVEVDETPESL